MTTVLGTVIGLFAIHFDLDTYTNKFASPEFALIFWACFVAIVAIIVGVTLYVFRRMRPH